MPSKKNGRKRIERTNSHSHASARERGHLERQRKSQARQANIVERMGADDELSLSPVGTYGGPGRDIGDEIDLWL